MANDAVSSLRIVKAPAAIGYWQGITSTESQDYSFHVGINYAVSQGTSEEIQASLTYGMQMGLDFGWLNFGTRVEASVAHSLSRDVQSTFGVDYSIENRTRCSTDRKEGAGLYQWIVATGDMQTQAFTWHTVCRTGELWNKPPECPFSMCLDPECVECDTSWNEMLE